MTTTNPSNNALEQYRLLQGLTYDALADRLDKPLETVRRWCKGISEPRKEDREDIQVRTGGDVISNPVLSLKPRRKR